MDISVREVRRNIKETVYLALEDVNWKECLLKKKKTFIKVNTVWEHLMPGVTTSPAVLDAVISKIKDYVGEIIVGDGDTFAHSVEKGFRKTGISKVCKRNGVSLLNLSKDEIIPVNFKGQYFDDNLKKLRIPKSILESDNFITIPVLKRHRIANMSGALKNQFGCLEVMRVKYHRDLTPILLDLNKFLKPNLAIMDATICLEGNGPIMGKPLKMNLILASPDPIIIDIIGAKLLGINLKNVDIVNEMIKKLNLNLDRINVIGERIENHIIKTQKPRNPFYRKFFIYILKYRILTQLLYSGKIWELSKKIEIRKREKWFTKYGKNYREKILKDKKYGLQYQF